MKLFAFKWQLVLVITLVSTATSAFSVTLIQNGQTQCVIVVPLEYEPIIEAARDLQYHLREMSGAEVPIVHEPSQVGDRKVVGIYIDTKPLDRHVPGRLVDRKILWPDGYVIEILASDGKADVFLSSPVVEGVRNAVYGLLEDHLGCRWFTPGKVGEHIPKRRTVTLEIAGNRDLAKPSFEKRTPWYNDDAMGHMGREERRKLVRWYRRNRHGEPLGPAGHGWHQMFTPESLGAVDEDKDGVSDLNPLVDGVRHRAFTGNGLCMSHPMAVDIAAKWLIDFFHAHPEFDHWSFSQGDAMQFCTCARCMAMGSNHGAHMLIMSNRVIERVNKVHPTKRITILPYEATLAPPKEFIPANTNLHPIIVSKGVDQILAKDQSPAFRRQVERWMTMLPRAWSYDYISWTSGPWPLFRSLQRTRDFYTHVGYTGVMDEYLGRNLGTDIHMWLSMRMAWDASLRVSSLLDEFYPSYFGAAAADMRQVYERIERHMLSVGPTSASMTILPRLYSADLIAQSLADVRNGKRKVSDDPTLVARIERDESCLTATQLWLRFWSALGSANRRATVSGRDQAIQSTKAYLNFVDGLDGTLTLGGGGMRQAGNLQLKGLTGTGTYITRAMDDKPLPGRFSYYDFFDQGGKVSDAKSWSGFHIGTHGLYLKPNTVGEIIYDVRTRDDQRFKEVFLPGSRTGWQAAISMALPKGGHNKIQVSLNQGQTWINAFEDLDTSVPVLRHDLTAYGGGTNQFLLKFWVQNTEKEILALDNWVLEGFTENAE